jgi:TrmH family RNA methyltransferase
VSEASPAANAAFQPQQPAQAVHPGADPLTARSPRVVAARRLLRRRHRDEDGRFLAEGPQAVREALDAEVVTELFATAEFLGRHPGFAVTARRHGVAAWPVTDAGLGALTETVTPQGVVAVCRHRHHDELAPVLAGHPSLVVVLAGVSDPGNAGTILRTADAAGAQAVVFPEGTVDAYNGKCVRASAGSLFHLELVRGVALDATVEQLKVGGVAVFAADAHGTEDLDTLADAGALSGPTAWLFGSEAHGLDPRLADLADARVRVAMHGRAESLNLAAAAAVCLYASARAHHRPGVSRHEHGHTVV